MLGWNQESGNGEKGREGRAAVSTKFLCTLEREVKVIISSGKRPGVYISVSMGDARKAANGGFWGR